MKKQRNRMIKRFLSVACVFLILFTLTPAFAAGDVSLKTLWVSGPGWIDFAPDVYQYTVQVPYRRGTSGDWELILPDVYAKPNDPTAKVSVAKGSDAIEVTVKSADETESQVYTLTAVGIGQNMYSNGGFENGTTGWSKVAGQLSTTTEEVGYGSSAMRVAPVPVLSPDVAWYPSTLPSLTNGKTYYASAMAKIANDSSIAERVSYYFFEGFTGTSAYHGTSSGSTLYLNKEYQTFGAVLKPSANCTTKQYFTNWGDRGGNPAMVVDDYYLGELVIADIEIVDEEGSIITSVMLPEEGTNSVQLSARAFNQYGNGAGLENETVSEWNLIGSPTGVSLSDSGLLTVDATAAENPELYVEAVIEPGFAGSVQTKVKAITKIIFGNPADSQLSSITINGESLAGFMPTIKNYTVKLPYMYNPENQTAPVPVVEAAAKNEDAEVTISDIDAADGGVVNITVETADGISSTYIINFEVIGKNLYTNGGFENGTTDWKISAGTMEITTDNPAEGSQALLVSGASPDRQWYGDVVLDAGKKYIASSMARMAMADTTYECSNFFDRFSGAIQYYTITGEQKGSGLITLTEEWQSTLAVLKSDSSYTVKNYFSNWGQEPDMVVDAYYIGELIISDILYTGKTEVQIPEANESNASIELTAKMFNQFNNGAGLEDEEIIWELKENYPGVSISNGVLAVTSLAHQGEICVVAKCNVNPSGAQGEYKEEIVIQLNSKNGEASLPRAYNVKADGIVKYEETLEADYDYYHVTNAEEGSTKYQWYQSDDIDGPFTPIPEETGSSLYVTEEIADKYIRVGITPETITGIQGKEVFSNILLKPTLPEAKNVKITGVGAVGQKYKGSYVYYDANGDIEENTEFQWLIGDSADGSFEPIEGETAMEYEIQPGDVDRYIKFRVIPHSVEDSSDETLYLSKAVLCATTPTVNNVKIKNVSKGVYSVEYDYSHLLDIEEGTPQISWTIDGKDAGTDSSVTVTGNKAQTLKVTVTPVASLPPYEGDSKTATYSIKGKETGGGSGGSGAGASLVVVPVPTVKNPVVDIPKKHWADEAISFVTEKGFMDYEANNDFAGDKQISRADFIYFVMKALGAEPGVYSGEFSDVASTDYYAGLLQKAVDMGIISHDEAFYPERNVSRQEVCKILVLAMKAEKAQEADLSIYKDNNYMQNWAKPYIAKAVANKILIGVSENEFSPLGNVTRNQTAVILKRLYEYNNGGEIK